MRFQLKDGSAVELNDSDPAELAAWFGNFGHSEHFRKVILASCREAERAKATLEGVKLTVDRTDDLARMSDPYVQYLTDTLKGRVAWEQNVLDSLVNR